MLYTADFETTTDPNDCRVWAYGICEIGNTDHFTFGNSMDRFMKKIYEMAEFENPTLYFHNLKFDGEFIIYWLFTHNFKFVSDRKAATDNTFCTLISDKGLFYSIEIFFKKRGRYSKKVTIYDSLKILPMSIAKIAKGFKLPMEKGDIDYNEYRPVGHNLTPQEISYLRRDVTIPALALKTLFDQGLDRMTQGSNALHSYKQMIGKKQFEKWFPIPPYDADVRQSYKGGFTYCSPLFQGKNLKNGLVLDVNSLYPSVMRYRPLPYGEGVYFSGQYKEDKLYNLYVQQLRCQFTLKKDKIPTIQIKSHYSSFLPTEYLRDSHGEDVILTLTSVDLELFFEQYEVYNIEYLSGWKFKSTTGLFSEYIDYWSTQKIQAKKEGNAAMYQLAKLMLNSLYGKFALNPRVQSKNPTIDNDGIIHYELGEEEMRDPIYIPVGTFITAWARYKTITSAQKVYKRFAYADTDSLHLVGQEIPEELKDEISDTELGLWKVEFLWSKARFIRQKTYLEIGREPEEAEKGKPEYIKVTCAGLPDNCRNQVTWKNFKIGATYTGKLMPKHVKGGIVLEETDFTIK